MKDAQQGNDLVYDHIFIVTYGRSGSTLLQGVLNSIDGVLVRGENNNFAYHLFEGFTALIEQQFYHLQAPTDATNAWFGIGEVDQDEVLANMRATMTSVILGDRAGDPSLRCIGFKEIRYYLAGGKLSSYLSFMERIFPNAGFILLTRDLEQVAKSAWWSNENPDSVKGSLSTFEARVRQHANGASNYFEIDYRDLVDRTQKLWDMFRFLGAMPDQKRLTEVMSKQHSYVPDPARLGRL